MANKSFTIDKSLSWRALTSPPSNPRNGEIYNDSTKGLLQFQNGNWLPFGSGSSSVGKNYLSGIITSNGGGSPNTGNGNFELGSTSGWSLAHSSLTSLFPTSTASAGTAFSSSNGGSAAAGTLSLSTVSSGQLSSNYSANLTSSVASTAGDLLISDAFYIDLEDQAKVLGFSFSYKVASGGSNLNFSGTNSNSFAVYIYDVTNGTWIQPAGVYNLVQGSGVGLCTGTFQTTSNSIRYQIALVNINASSGLYSLYLDDFFIGPQIEINGPAVSDWQSYTLVVGGTTSTPTPGTVSINNAQWRRIGDSIEIEYSFAQTSAGSNGSGTYLFPIPSGLTIDTTKFTVSTGNVESSVGSSIVLATTTNFLGTVEIYNSTNLALIIGNDTTSPQSLNSALAGFVNNPYRISFTARVPIAGWSSNSVMSNDTDTRVVAASANSTISSSLTAGFTTIVYSSVLFDTHTSYNPSTGFYTVPVTGYYEVTASYLISATFAPDDNYQLQIVTSGGETKSAIERSQSTSTASRSIRLTAVFHCNAGETISAQATSNSTGAAYTTSNDNFLDIRRLSGPAVIAARESVNARYTSAAGQSIPNLTETVVNFDTKDYDSHGSVTTGSSWKFTAPISGIYRVSAIIQYTDNATGERQLLLSKNGSDFTLLSDFPGTSPVRTNSSGSDSIRLLAGDYIQINTFQNSGGSLALINSADRTVVAIERVGNY